MRPAYPTDPGQPPQRWPRAFRGVMGSKIGRAPVPNIAVLWLCSVADSFVTGRALVAEGGQRL